MKNFFNIYVILSYMTLLLVIIGFNVYYFLTTSTLPLFLDWVNFILAIFILARWSVLIVRYLLKRYGNTRGLYI